MALYEVKVRISKQEDGLYRAECPDLQGCFVDDRTLEGALANIQDAIQVWLSSQKTMGWEFPKKVSPRKELPLEMSIPVEVA